MKVLAYVILALLFLGFLGKLADHDIAIKQLEDKPVTVATVDLTEKTILRIAILEKEIDMLKLRVEELEAKPEVVK